MFVEDFLEELKRDVESNQLAGCRYVDTWDYEDEYSHNEIEEVRHQFIDMANDYFKENNMPYMMKEIVENAMICDLNGRILK